MTIPPLLPGSFLSEPMNIDQRGEYGYIKNGYHEIWYAGLPYRSLLAGILKPILNRWLRVAAVVLGLEAQIIIVCVAGYEGRIIGRRVS